MKTCLCDRKFYRVEHRNHYHSSFAKPQVSAHLSAYSGIRCLSCSWCFRSKALWVMSCPDITEADWEQLLEGSLAPNIGYSVSIQGWGNRLREGKE